MPSWAGGSRSPAATCAPSARSVSAMRRPMPRAAPVTSATRPSKPSSRMRVASCTRVSSPPGMVSNATEEGGGPQAEGGLRGGWRAGAARARTACTTSARRWPTWIARWRSGRPSWAAPAASRRCSSGRTSARSLGLPGHQDRRRLRRPARRRDPGAARLPAPDRVPHVDDTRHPGNVHLCFRVEDADAAWARAVAAAPGRSTPTARDLDGGPNKGAKVAYLRDPDGISLELFQLPPLLVERRYERLSGAALERLPGGGAARVRPRRPLEHHGPHLPLGSTASRRTSSRCGPRAPPAASCSRPATWPPAASTCRAR